MTLYQPFRQISRSIKIWRHRHKDPLRHMCPTRCSLSLCPIGHPHLPARTTVLWASIRISAPALRSQAGLISVPIAEQECVVMNRVTSLCLLLIFPALFGVQSWAQDSAPHVEGARARPAITSPPVALTPQRLFSAISISTPSDEACKFVELAIDKY